MRLMRTESSIPPRDMLLRPMMAACNSRVMMAAMVVRPSAARRLHLRQQFRCHRSLRRR